MGDIASDPQQEYRKERYDSYVKERDALRSESLEISGRYDKSVLFLAGGALALSVTFIEKIAPHPLPWSFIILLVAWILLILAVMFELHALATSQNALHQQIRSLDAEYDAFVAASSGANSDAIPTSEPSEVENRAAVRTQWLNLWSLRFLGTGIALVCVFSALNLPYAQQNNNMPETARLTRGSYVPPTNVRPPPPPPPPSTPPQPPAPSTPKR